MTGPAGSDSARTQLPGSASPSGRGPEAWPGAEPETNGKRARIFLGVVTLVALVLHVYPAVRLLGSTDIMSTGLSVLLGLLLGLGFALMLVVGHAQALDVVGTIADIWLGVIFQLAVWTLLGEPLRLIFWLAGVPSVDRTVSLVVIGWTILMLTYGLRRALGPVEVVRSEVRLPRLHPDLDGLRILQVTDTHLSRVLGRGWMAEIVRRVNEINADIYCHTGDLADGSPSRRDDAVAEIGQVAGAHKYYITGNHEYFGDASHWGDRMTALGWTFLHNTHVVYERGAGKLVIAGIDDPTGAISGLVGHGPDLRRALKDAPRNAAILLLAHQPKQARQASAYGVDLQLSGHTHGGQIWPFHFLVRVDQKYLAGLYRVSRRTQIYVSRGTGFWGPPFRIGARPEISLLTLRSA